MSTKQASNTGSGTASSRNCPCGARRTDGQIGLEPTPDEFVATMVAVFDEVWRVMRDDATAWINLGDSYGPDGQLLGVPWRFAFAMQERGWRLRSDIVWSKLPMPNPMPESVTNRPTKAHEMLFLFAKGRRRAGQFANVSEADARWLALLFDTEGNIVIKRAQNGERLQYGAQVAFANTSRPLLERAQAIVGAGSIHERLGRNAPVYYWQMSGREARDLLCRIYPFLIVKQRQARVAIHMQNEIARPKKRPGRYRTSEHASFLERCWLTVKALNKFGGPDLSWVPEPNVFLLSKGPRYFYDADAIREPHDDKAGGPERFGNVGANGGYKGGFSRECPDPNVRPNFACRPGGREYNPAGRNKRSVWTVATAPYAGAHFATFPPKLIEPCILAGAPERACGECGAPWVRVVERDGESVAERQARATRDYTTMPRPDGGSLQHNGAALTPAGGKPSRTLGFEPSCSHHGKGEHVPQESPEGRDFSRLGSSPDVSNACLATGEAGPQAQIVPGVVLDPFAGAGTTGLVALQHGREFVGIELSPEYARMARERIETAVRLGFRAPTNGPEQIPGQVSIFDLDGAA